MTKRVRKLMMPLLLTAFVVTNLFGAAVFAEESNAGTVNITPTLSGNQTINKNKDKYENSPGSISELNLNQIQKLLLTTTGSAIVKDYTMDKEVVFVLDNSGALSLTDVGNRSIFTYGLISASGTEPFYMENQGLTVNGDIHSNCYIVNKTDTVKLQSGVLSSVGQHIFTGDSSKIDFFGRNQSDVIKDGEPTKTLPPFSSILTDQQETDFEVIDISTPPNSGNPEIYIGKGNGPPLKQIDNTMLHTDSSPGLGKINLLYSQTTGSNEISCKNYGTFSIQGEGTFVVKDKQTYYFDGNLSIDNNNGLEFEGSGRIIAKGDILVKGQNFKSREGSKSLLYSEGGNVVLTPSMWGKNPSYNGTMYAPNGMARIATEGTTVNGCIIADRVNIGVTNITINAVTDEDLVDAVNKLFKVSYFGTAKSAIESFKNRMKLQLGNPINGKKGSVKIGIIPYAETAILPKDSPSFKLNEVKNEGSDEVDSILSSLSEQDSKRPSNLGDGLRRAYELLSDPTQSSDRAAKYVVVISGAIPNAWTTNTVNMDKDGNKVGDATEVGYFYKEGEIGSTLKDPKFEGGIIAKGSDSRTEAVNYAKEYMKKIDLLNSNENTTFIAINKKLNKNKYPNASEGFLKELEDAYAKMNAMLIKDQKDINPKADINANPTIEADENVEAKDSKGKDLTAKDPTTSNSSLDTTILNALTPITTLIENEITGIKLDKATITLHLSDADYGKGKYFKAGVVRDITNSNYTSDGAINLLEKSIGPANGKIFKTWSGDIKADIKAGTFTMPDFYIPLKYSPLGTSTMPKDPTITKITEAIKFKIDIKVDITYTSKAPTGKDGDAGKLYSNVTSADCTVTVADDVNID